MRAPDARRELALDALSRAPTTFYRDYSCKGAASTVSRGCDATQLTISSELRHWFRELKFIRAFYETLVSVQVLFCVF